MKNLQQLREHRRKILGSGWYRYLWQEMETPYMNQLNAFITNEYNKYEVLPAKDKIFRAFRMCPIDKVKVVIIGQDPYPSGGHANGVAFATDRDSCPPSLQVIFRSLHLDYGPSKHRRYDLSHWYSNGVLLLNSRLTVRANEPKSHLNYGWERFMVYVIDIINSISSPFIISMGADAKKVLGTWLYKENNRCMAVEHPMASWYQKRDWDNDHCFEKANLYLTSRNIEPINW